MTNLTPECDKFLELKDAIADANTREELFTAAEMQVFYGPKAAQQYLMTARDRRALKAPRQSDRRLRWLKEAQRLSRARQLF
jgi:hypothetical protein